MKKMKDIEEYSKLGLPNLIGIDSAYSKAGVACFRSGVLTHNLKLGRSLEQMMDSTIMQEGLHQPFVARTFTNKYEKGEKQKGELITGDCARDKAVNLAIKVRDWAENERMDFQTNLQQNAAYSKGDNILRCRYQTRTDRTIIIVESPREIEARGWGNPTTHSKYAFANGTCVGMMIQGFEVLLKYPKATPLKDEARSILTSLYPALQNFIDECNNDEIDALMCIFWYLWNMDDELFKQTYQLG